MTIVECVELDHTSFKDEFTVRMNLLVRAACVVSPLELIVYFSDRSFFLYVQVVHLERITSSTILLKSKVQLIDTTLVLPCYKLNYMKAVSSQQE